MHLITDPQLAAGLAGFEEVVPGGITLDDIPATRQFFDVFAPDTETSQRFTAEYTRILSRALHG